MSNSSDFDSNSDLMEESKVEYKKPKMFKVMFFNDDFTPFEFVEGLLMGLFGKSEEEALLITKKVHEHGKAIVAIYTKEIAEMKVLTANGVAQKNGYPFKSDFESE